MLYRRILTKVAGFADFLDQKVKLNGLERVNTLILCTQALLFAIEKDNILISSTLFKQNQIISKIINPFCLTDFFIGKLVKGRKQIDLES